jgi:tetratricopeptide (TPR) repeat protein
MGNSQPDTTGKSSGRWRVARRAVAALLRLVRLPLDVVFLTFDFLRLTLWGLVQLGVPIWGRRWQRFGARADADAVSVGTARLRRCTLGRKYGNPVLLKLLVSRAFVVRGQSGRTAWVWEQGAAEAPTTVTRYVTAGLALAMFWGALALPFVVPAVRRALRQHIESFFPAMARTIGARPGPDTRQRAMALCTEADGLFAAGSYREARSKYREVLAVEPGSIAAQLGYGLSALALGLDEDARASLVAVLRDAPGNTRATRGMAQLAYRTGGYRTAVDMLRRFLAAEPDDTEALALLAEAHRHLGELDRALSVAREGLAKTPGDQGLLLAAARVHLDREELDEAEGLFRKAMEGGKAPAGGQIGLARVLRLRGRNAECEAMLEAVLGESPDHPEAATMLVDLWAAQGELARAVELCRQVTERHPENYPLRERQGTLLLARADYDSAYVSAAALLRDQPGNTTALLQLATLFLAKGLPSLAIEHCQAVLRQDSGLEEPHRLLATAYMVKGDPKQAAARLEAILQGRPDDLESLVRLAECQARAGDAAKALTTLEAAAQRHPLSPIPLTELGRHLYAVGQADRALAAFRKAYELAPGEWSTCNNLAQMLASQEKELDLALELATKAFGLASTSPNVADTLGWVYVLKGAYDKAAPLLTFAMVSQADSPMVLYHAAELRARAGDKESALALARRAVELDKDYPDVGRAKLLIEKLSGAGKP